MAVGNDYHSVLSMDDVLLNSLFQAAKEENEPFWRLPFEEFHRSQIHFFFLLISQIQALRQLWRAQVLQQHFYRIL